MYYFSIPFSFYPFIFARGSKFGNVSFTETENRLKLKIYHAERRAISAWADRPAEMTASRPPVEVLRASSYTPRMSMARFARGLPQLGRAAHGPLRGLVAGSMGESEWASESDVNTISETFVV